MEAAFWRGALCAWSYDATGSDRSLDMGEVTGSSPVETTNEDWILGPWLILLNKPMSFEARSYPLAA